MAVIMLIDNSNGAVIMQTFAGITGTIAGFAIAAIVLLIGSASSQDHEERKGDLIAPTVASLIGTFFTSIWAACLFASGSGQLPQDSNRTLTVIVPPLFIFAISLTFLLTGFVLL